MSTLDSFQSVLKVIGYDFFLIEADGKQKFLVVRYLMKVVNSSRFQIFIEAKALDYGFVSLIDVELFRVSIWFG